MNDQRISAIHHQTQPTKVRSRHPGRLSNAQKLTFSQWKWSDRNNCSRISKCYKEIIKNKKATWVLNWLLSTSAFCFLFNSPDTSWFKVATSLCSRRFSRTSWDSELGGSTARTTSSFTSTEGIFEATVGGVYALWRDGGENSACGEIHSPLAGNRSVELEESCSRLKNGKKSTHKHTSCSQLNTAEIWIKSKQLHFHLTTHRAWCTEIMITNTRGIACRVSKSCNYQIERFESSANERENKH